jgi:hypothetical protein
MNGVTSMDRHAALHCRQRLSIRLDRTGGFSKRGLNFIGRRKYDRRKSEAEKYGIQSYFHHSRIPLARAPDPGTKKKYKKYDTSLSSLFYKFDAVTEAISAFD